MNWSRGPASSRSAVDAVIGGQRGQAARSRVEGLVGSRQRAATAGAPNQGARRSGRSRRGCRTSSATARPRRSSRSLPTPRAGTPSNSTVEPLSATLASRPPSHSWSVTRWRSRQETSELEILNSTSKPTSRPSRGLEVGSLQLEIGGGVPLAGDPAGAPGGDRLGPVDGVADGRTVSTTCRSATRVAAPSLRSDAASTNSPR
jgi:hypothetical protein